MIRRQLPAYSPVHPSGLVGASLDVTLSPRGTLELFGHELRERFEAERVALTSSGTHALQLALGSGEDTIGGAGRVVALPAFSCYDLVTAAVGASVPVVFYDIDPRTLTPDLDSIRAALRRGAAMVVAANLYGFPLDWDGLRTECRAAGAVLVEDAAQGLGSRWRERDGGTFGDLTVLSFGRGKGWSGGGGGALLIRHEAAHRAEIPRLDGPAAGTTLRAFGVSWALWGLGRPSLYRLPSSAPGLKLGETIYKEPTPVRRMAAGNAAIARRHGPATWAAVAERRANAASWEALAESEFGGVWPLRPCSAVPGGESGYLRYPLLARSSGERACFLEVASDVGGAAGYPVPLSELEPAAAITADSASHCPGARQLVECLVTLPTHPRVDARDFGGFDR